MKNANKYKDLIEFWKEAKIPDGSGGWYPKYLLDFDDYAMVVTKDEKRTIQETQVVLEGYFEIYLRFRPDVDIKKTHNIKFNNSSLTIHSIVNECNKEFKLICTESDNNIEVFENENPYENYDGVPLEYQNTLPFKLL